MPTLTITLSKSHKDFLKAKTKKGQLASESQYISLLIHGEKLKEQRDKIDALLLEAMNSGPGTPMTEQDWKKIEIEGLARLAEEEKHAGKPQKKRRRPKRSA